MRHVKTKLKSKSNAYVGNWKKIRVFHYVDRPHFRELIWRTALVNMDKFIVATPANYALGYGEEQVLRTIPYTEVTYPHQIDKEAYVELHFHGSTFFNMLKSDFREAFGIEPPSDLG